MNMNRFTINFIDRTIIGTKTSFAKAGKGYGPEYEELADKMARYPEYKLVQKELKNNVKSKRSYKGMNVAFIKEYISIQENAEEMMDKFTAIERMAKASGIAVFPTIKKWFLEKYSSEENPFDMEAAKNMLSDFRIKHAESEASSVSEKQLTQDNTILYQETLEEVS